MAVTVTAAMVKALRDITQAGVMDCKKALIEAEGNQEAAVEILRKAGLAMAAKKSSRIAAEGLVNFAISEDGKKAAIVEVNSETDFVAKNELFRNFVAKVAKQALTTKAANLDEFKAEPWIDDPSQTVGDALVALVAVIHENLQIRRFEIFESENYIASYIHGQGKIGVLVDMGCQEVNDVVKDAGKHIAMQVCAMNPQFLDEASVDPAWVAKEKEIILAQIAQDPKNANKPAMVQEKMSIGKLNKRYKEVCLLDQEYSFGDDQTVAQYLKETSKKVGFEVTVKKFIRYETGEGIEKKEENFAEEVAKQMQN